MTRKRFIGNREKRKKKQREVGNLTSCALAKKFYKKTPGTNGTIESNKSTAQDLNPTPSLWEEGGGKMRSEEIKEEM